MSALAAVIQASNSGRAEPFRASTAARAAGSSCSSCVKRGRSSGFGTGTIGGVSWTLPSIAGWVVLLKNADSS